MSLHSAMVYEYSMAFLSGTVSQLLCTSTGTASLIFMHGLVSLF